MAKSLLIAWHDIRRQLRQGATLLWLLLMPPIFFYFIGTVTGGFSSGTGGGVATPLTVQAEAPGFVADQIEKRLTENDFTVEWVDQTTLESLPKEERPRRVLELSPRLTERLLAEEKVEAHYDTRASALSRDFEAVRINRAMYTVLADVAIGSTLDAGPLSPAALDDLNSQARIWQLDVSPAGKRQEIPSGFEQAVPGILVMFTLIILLTTGGSMLAVERESGLLRRLASAPMTRSELVAGKWLGRMGLAAVQVTSALIMGTYMFDMHWGPNPGMVLLVLAGWAAFCASAGLLLGSVARSEKQAVGLGVLTANVLAALGGCWWPIEITPEWMQLLQKFLPTGWTMDAIHRLVSFEAGAASAIPHLAALLLGTLLVGGLAVRAFRYE
ncbi:MAG: ABC transporter permease [Xanthomonadales bacterium]|nr:ABC transporter permease [Xanthomonadales bacterium]